MEGINIKYYRKCMNGDPEDQREKTQKRQPPKPRSTIVRIFRAFKRDENRLRSKTQQQINEQMMARWTRHVGWFTLALVLVSIATAIIFWRQLNVMQGQLDETKAEQRPWVSVSIEIAGPISRNQTGRLAIPLRYILKNTGHLPAISAEMNVLVTAKPQNAFAAQEAVCGGSRRNYGGGVSVFPEETFPPIQSDAIPIGDLELPSSGELSSFFVNPTIAGCVNYLFPSKQRGTHLTKFVYGVTPSKQANGYPPGCPSKS
jgi:hypothetical protein